jgi:predicted 3-demethylubiquinone-9 3-methyltransferase (glyoxalase superfamily)
MPTITPFLWFDDQLEEALEFYTSIFDDAKVLQLSRRDGKAFTATFELAGQKLMGLNGGPQFTFTPAISLFVECETQEHVDELWARLSDGGETNRCGWLTDRFGLSWQIVPRVLLELMSDEDPEKVRRVTDAMLAMTKLEIAELEAAAR